MTTSGECENAMHEACDGTTPGWPCECPCHEVEADGSTTGADS